MCTDKRQASLNGRQLAFTFSMDFRQDGVTGAGTVAGSAPELTLTGADEGKAQPLSRCQALEADRRFDLHLLTINPNDQDADGSVALPSVNAKPRSLPDRIVGVWGCLA